MNFFILTIFVSFSAFTTTPIDERLVGYIQKFNLIPLSAPAARKQKLFILGRDLFHDRRISGNDNISCMDCHHPRVGTADGLPLSLGEGANGLQIGNRKRMQAEGRVLARNTPALFNLHRVNVMFWDGQAYAAATEQNPAITGDTGTEIQIPETGEAKSYQFSGIAGTKVGITLFSLTPLDGVISSRTISINIIPIARLAIRTTFLFLGFLINTKSLLFMLTNLVFNITK